MSPKAFSLAGTDVQKNRPDTESLSWQAELVKSGRERRFAFLSELIILPAILFSLIKFSITIMDYGGRICQDIFVRKLHNCHNSLLRLYLHLSLFLEYLTAWQHERMI